MKLLKSRRVSGPLPPAPVRFADVSAVLIFGKGVASHGSDDMPVWGAKFRKIDPEHDRSGQKHIDDLVAYLESIQAK
jgi:hypothetical protein